VAAKILQRRRSRLSEETRKIEQGFALYQGFKSPPVFYPQLIGMRAVAFAQAGQPAEGLKLIDGLLKDVDKERLLRILSPLLLLKGFGLAQLHSAPLTSLRQVCSSTRKQS
jgi:hypothetical protein